MSDPFLDTSSWTLDGAEDDTPPSPPPIMDWIRESTREAEREAKLLRFGQLFGHDVLERYATEHGRWYVRPSR